MEPARTSPFRTVVDTASSPENRDSRAALPEFLPARCKRSVSAMSDHLEQPQEEPVAKLWPQFVQGTLGVFLLVGSGFAGSLLCAGAYQ